MRCAGRLLPPQPQTNRARRSAPRSISAPHGARPQAPAFGTAAEVAFETAAGTARDATEGSATAARSAAETAKRTAAETASGFSVVRPNSLLNPACAAVSSLAAPGRVAAKRHSTVFPGYPARPFRIPRLRRAPACAERRRAASQRINAEKKTGATRIASKRKRTERYGCVKNERTQGSTEHGRYASIPPNQLLYYSRVRTRFVIVHFAELSMPEYRGVVDFAQKG